MAEKKTTPKTTHLVGGEVFIPTLTENFSKKAVSTLKKDVLVFLKEEYPKPVKLNFGGDENIPKSFFEFFFGDKKIKKAKEDHKFLLTNLHYKHRHAIKMAENW